MPANDRKPEKYYKFTAQPGSLECEAYTCTGTDPGAGTLSLTPDAPGGKNAVTVRAGWIGKPHAGVLWDTDPDLFKAYAKMLDDASRKAFSSRRLADADSGILARVKSASPSMPSARPGAAPDAYLEIPGENGQPVRIPLDEILKSAGIRKTPCHVRLGISRDGLDLYAEIEPMEIEYPGITVDGFTKDAGTVWLGNFEMPCETYPSRIAARLYAGCSGFETGDPIAIVTHDVTDRPLLEKRTAEYAGGEFPRKLVYVERKLALSRAWTEAGEDAMPEHLEDEGK